MDHLNLPPSLAFTLLKKARLEVADHLNTYFSLSRRNSALCPRSPHHFELNCQMNLSGLAVLFFRTIPFFHRGHDPRLLWCELS